MIKKVYLIKIHGQQDKQKQRATAWSTYSGEYAGLLSAAFFLLAAYVYGWISEAGKSGPASDTCSFESQINFLLS
jgi:hypothetical protein